MGRNNIAGAWGEAVAAEYLRKKRYQLVATGYRCRYGEIDLIVASKTHLVFVEGKLRKNDRFGAAADAVTFSKQDKLRKTAASWLAAHDCDAPTRFDVIEIYTDPGRINHIENAFE